MAAPKYFATPTAFRAWFEQHHADRDELMVGFHTIGSGRPSITWPQAVDVVLCFGWIDGVRRNVDATRYSIRFTPRRARSIWSAKNIARIRELIADDVVVPAGLRAFEARTDDRSAVYSFEQREAPVLPRAATRRFKANAAAWKFFQAQPPGYRRVATHWVVSAKQEATRDRRLATLIADSAAGRRLAQLTPRRPKRG